MQVIGKACKPIPVMILGVVLAKKVYPLIKYLCIVMIVSGVAMFLYKDSKATNGAAFELGAGELLLVSYRFFHRRKAAAVPKFLRISKELF